MQANKGIVDLMYPLIGRDIPNHASDITGYSQCHGRSLKWMSITSLPRRPGPFYGIGKVYPDGRRMQIAKPLGSLNFRLHELVKPALLRIRHLDRGLSRNLQQLNARTRI